MRQDIPSGWFIHILHKKDDSDSGLFSGPALGGISIIPPSPAQGQGHGKYYQF